MNTDTCPRRCARLATHDRGAPATLAPRGQRRCDPQRLPQAWRHLLESAETSLATEAAVVESEEEFRSGMASRTGFLVTITACLGSRAWRRMARASLCVAPLRDLPLMDRTSLPF